MCGRFTLGMPQKIPERFNVRGDLPVLKASYNIAPSQNVPVVLKNSSNSAVLMKWGYLPSWADPKKMKTQPINARADSLKKPFYKHSFENHRCLVPATGWYEWKVLDLEGREEKWPFYFSLKSMELFGLGGICSKKVDSEGKEHYFFALITVDPSKKAAKVHDRMPLVIKKDDEKGWLSSDTDMEKIKDMLKPYPSEKTQYWRVTRKVNSPRNDSEKLIENVE